MTTRTVKFKKGEVVPLDCAYEFMGIIPIDTYEQDDFADYKHTNGNDSGETLRFIKNVTIKVTVVVT